MFGDDRGFFMESWNARQVPRRPASISRSCRTITAAPRRGVLRGLHFQNPNPQGKLVRVVGGRGVGRRGRYPPILAAPSGNGSGVELSAANKRMFWVPPGFAHGFVSLEDGTDFLYKCTALYDPAHEHSLLWNDPAIGIEWPLDGIEPQLSAKDKVGKPLAEIEAFA